MNILLALKYHVLPDKKTNVYRPLWLLSSFLNSLYSFYWDVVRDWDMRYVWRLNVINFGFSFVDCASIMPYSFFFALAAPSQHDLWLPYMPFEIIYFLIHFHMLACITLPLQCYQFMLLYGPLVLPNICTHYNILLESSCLRSLAFALHPSYIQPRVFLLRCSNNIYVYFLFLCQLLNSDLQVQPNAFLVSCYIEENW